MSAVNQISRWQWRGLPGRLLPTLSHLRRGTEQHDVPAGPAGCPERLVPDLADAPELLRDRVRTLAARGGLDEGNHQAFHEMINAWAALWAMRATHEHCVRQSVLNRRRAQAQVQRDVLTQRLATAQGELGELQRRIARLQAAPSDQSRPRGSTP
jgi:hypothetical protein